ncbi:MAG: DUF423 domain-containing protein [Armatimonadetes bacterium]|nr:DUF423 domain-containing protein [Armatimonadota bacterium]
MNRWVTFGAVNMAVGVTLGAFGAHALEDRFDARQMELWMTAQQYQIWHALGLILIGLLAAKTGKDLKWPGWLLTIGIVIFSGSLYLLALTDAKWLGAITPFGGACFIVGWLVLAIGMKSARTQ